MRTYLFIMAVSITCGGGKGGEDASATESSTGEATSGLSGSDSDEAPTEASDSTPVTSTDTGPSGVTTGQASGMSESATADPTTLSTGGDEATGGESTGSNEATGGESTGAGAPQNATVDDGCAPDDGAALEFRIGVDAATCGSPWSGDQLRILLYQGDPLAPGVYPLDNGSGGATFDDGQGLVFGSSGTLTIDAWAEDAVAGSYEVTLEDNSVHSGSFVGPHCMTMPMCG